MRPAITYLGVAAVALTAWTLVRETSGDASLVEVADVAHRQPRSAPAEQTKPEERWVIERAAWGDASADPFVAKQPPPPPPPPVLQLPPPKPTAPPFPYQFGGRTTSPEGKEGVYLTQANRLIPVAVNETLDGVYRIDSVSESQIVVTYLPLSEKTIIATPSARPLP